MKSLLLVPLLLVVLVAIGGVVFWQVKLKSKETPQTQAPASNPVSRHAQPAPQSQPVSHPAQPATVNASPVPAKPVPAPPAATTAKAVGREPAPIIMGPSASPGAAVPPVSGSNIAVPQPDKPVAKEPAKWPDLELQAIFFRIKNPSILINGQNLNVGDSIQGVRVHAIDRESATLELEGVRKVYKAK